MKKLLSIFILAAVFIACSDEFLETENKNSLETKKIISGDDLKEMGLNPSPLFKEILEEVENLQLENVIHTREEALAKRLESGG